MKRLQLLLLLLIAHLDKEHPIAEAKTKLVKELDVFQQVVVAGTSVTVLVVVPGFGIIKNLSTRRKNTSDHLLISSLTTGFILLAVIKACSSLWLVIKGTRHIGTTSEPLGFTCSKKIPFHLRLPPLQVFQDSAQCQAPAHPHSNTWPQPVVGVVFCKLAELVLRKGITHSQLLFT